MEYKEDGGEIECIKETPLQDYGTVGDKKKKTEEKTVTIKRRRL